MTDYERFANANEYADKKFNKKRSQKDMCLEYLRQFKSITPLEALQAFNCFRLAAIIHLLREEGYDIITNINDNGKRYAIYVLAE